MDFLNEFLKQTGIFDLSMTFACYLAKNSMCQWFFWRLRKKIGICYTDFI